MRIALFTIAIVLLTSGCAKQQASDDSIAAGIKARLSSDAGTRSANVNVDVKDGIVTLGGEVPSSDVELAAMKIANATSGVKRVNDQMKVNPALASNSPQNPNATPQPTPSAPEQPQTAANQQTPPEQPSAPQPAGPPSGTPPPAAPPAKPEPVEVIIPAGERIVIRMIDSIDSSQNAAGEAFRASLYSPLVAHGKVVVPAGSNASVLLTQARQAGRVQGRSQLELRLSKLEYEGRTYKVASSLYQEQGKSRGAETAKRTGAGAVAGAVIGALAGGGKGAAIGSAVGGGGAAGYQILTRGQRVKVPSESILTFRLEAPLRIRK